MQKLKAKPMNINTFLLCWMLASYLLYPLMILPTSFLIYILPPYPLYERLDTIYWNGLANQIIFLAVFTPAMAWLQAWMFRRLVFIRIRFWEIATIVGGWLGLTIMWFVPQNPPYEMFAWFLGIGLAQFLLLRQTVKNAWLWLFAQLSLSLFFPIYGNDWQEIVLQWLLATSLYGLATLLVLREMGQNWKVEES